MSIEEELNSGGGPLPPSMEGGTLEELKAEAVVINPGDVESSTILTFHHTGEDLPEGNVYYISDVVQFQAPPPPQPQPQQQLKPQLPPPQIIPSTTTSSFSGTTTTTTWNYLSGAQIAPSIPYRAVTPTMRRTLAEHPSIELIEVLAVERGWKTQPRQFIARCHACLRRFTSATADSVVRHARSAKHQDRLTVRPVPVPTTDLQGSSSSTSSGMEEALRLRTLRALISQYPDFGLVDERDMHQNEIFEYRLPPEERTLALNDLYCKVCRRKLQSDQKLYKKSMIRHLGTNQHKRKLAAAAERAAKGGPPPKPTKISTRIFRVDRDGVRREVLDEDEDVGEDERESKNKSKKSGKKSSKKKPAPKKKPTTTTTAANKNTVIPHYTPPVTNGTSNVSQM